MFYFTAKQSLLILLFIKKKNKKKELNMFTSTCGYAHWILLFSLWPLKMKSSTYKYFERKGHSNLMIYCVKGLAVTFICFFLFLLCSHGMSVWCADQDQIFRHSRCILASWISKWLCALCLLQLALTIEQRKLKLLFQEDLKIIRLFLWYLFLGLASACTEDKGSKLAEKGCLYF